MEKIKSKWQNTIKSSVNESILDSDMEELLIESGVIKKASSIINNQLSKTEDDDNKTKKLPKGFWGKLIGSVTKVADWAVDIMDIFYKSKARASLSGLSIALDKSGGPKKPDNGINHLGTLYSHAGIHSQGGIAGGGMLKNWKRTLGVAIRQTVSFAVSSIQSVIGPIMSIIISIIQIVKKLQVCVFITRMANGDMKKEKIDKESTKDLSGGVKKFLAKDAE